MKMTNYAGFGTLITGMIWCGIYLQKNYRHGDTVQIERKKSLPTIDSSVLIYCFLVIIIILIEE